MAIANYYVDPLNGSDSTGTGASGAPWKSTQKALNTITQGTSGDQINIKNTADDVLAATLSLATYGTVTSAKPLIFSGYTSAANDGGIGGISGNSGGFTILTSANPGIFFKAMHLHHCGASAILNLSGGNNNVENCEIDHSTSGVAVTCASLFYCYFHDISGTTAASVSNALYNYFNVAATTAALIGSQLQENAIVVSVAGGVGIRLTGGGIAERNSVYNSASGTAAGIQDNAANNVSVVDNVIEGWSGAGGKGLQLTGLASLRAGNRAFNCATGFSVGVVIDDYGTDVVPGSSDFNNASGGDLTLVPGSGARSTPGTPATYPGTYKGQTYKSYRDKGAFQSQPGGGGGDDAVLVSGPQAWW